MRIHSKLPCNGNSKAVYISNDWRNLMKSTELRKELENYLIILKRNPDKVSLETLKTKYKKPFGELQHNISATATAYVKQIALENIRIRADFFEEAQPLIQSAIDQSGILQKISVAAFQKQDISEIDCLAATLKEQIHQTLIPFYERHIRLYLDGECFETPPGAPKFYNEATGCIWKGNAWIPLELDKKALLFPVQDKPKTAA